MTVRPLRFSPPGFGHGAVPETPSWTFFTNHAHVLLCLAGDPTLRIRDLAMLVGITERAVQRIVRELASEGFLEVRKVGRRNHYTIHGEKNLRHVVEAHSTVGDIISLVRSMEPAGSAADTDSDAPTDS